MSKAKECGDKVQYRTEAEAKAALSYGYYTRGLFRVGTYHCRYCDFYHLGHTPRGPKRKRY